MRLAFWTALTSSLVVIGAALIILVVTDSLVRDRLQEAVSVRLEQQLDKEISLLQARLDAVGNDMKALARSPTLRAWLDSRGDGVERAAWWRRLNSKFVTAIATHRNYAQLRFIDLDGRERVRVDRRDGDMTITQPADFQNKSHRGYIRHALALEADNVHVSPLNLNREHGVIERPLRPTLRLAVPVFDSEGERRGAVIVNLNAESLLPPRDFHDAHFVMLDEKGAFLRHVDQDREFGLELESGVTLARDYPEAAGALAGRSDGSAQLVRGITGSGAELLAFRQIAYNPGDLDHRWTMILIQPEALAFAPVESLSGKLIAIVLGVTMLACAAGWLLAHRLTKPLGRITEVARRITAGALDTTIDIEGGGEIAELGAAFEVMTSRLRQMIDDQRRINAALEKANLELQRSNQDLADFAHAASHDLRTPLRALRTLPEWIRDDLSHIALPEEVGKNLFEMQAQGERMDDVISGLLEYSRIGRSNVSLQACNLRSIAEKTLNFLAIPGTFRVELSLGSDEIDADPTEIELILRNLVQNAVKHHDRAKGTICIAGTSSDEAYVLEVSDDGPGIPTEFHERVLLPFRALKRRDEGGGTGLGLALINKIVQRAGGRLEIVSEAGTRGACFRIILPTMSPHPAERVNDGAISNETPKAA